jgi:hypothetical protein
MPCIPTRFASGGWLTVPSGADQPVYVQAAPTIPRPQFWDWGLPLDVAILSTLLAVTRVIVNHSRTSEQKRKGDGHSSPCLKAGVSWPKIR